MIYGEGFMGEGSNIPLRKFDYLKGSFAEKVMKEYLKVADEKFENHPRIRDSAKIRTNHSEYDSEKYWIGVNMMSLPEIDKILNKEGYRIAGMGDFGQALLDPKLNTKNYSYLLGIIIGPEAKHQEGFERELRDMAEARGFDASINPVYIPATSLESRLDNSCASGVSVKLMNGALPRYMKSLNAKNTYKKFDNVTNDGPQYKQDGEFEAMLTKKGISKVAFGGKRMWAFDQNLSGISNNERILYTALD